MTKSGFSTSLQSNTILSSSSSLFTFLLSLIFLGEQFTWVKLIGVLLCMGGTIIVSLGDSETGSSKIASNAALGDILSLISAAFYAIYISLIRKKLPDDEDGKHGRPSMAQFLGFLGLFNLLIFLPIALVLSIAKLEHFNTLTWKQFGLITGKGMFRLNLHFLVLGFNLLSLSNQIFTLGNQICDPISFLCASAFLLLHPQTKYVNMLTHLAFCGSSPDFCNRNAIVRNFQVKYLIQKLCRLMHTNTHGIHLFSYCCHATSFNYCL